MISHRRKNAKPNTLPVHALTAYAHRHAFKKRHVPPLPLVYIINQILNRGCSTFALCCSSLTLVNGIC